MRSARIGPALTLMLLALLAWSGPGSLVAQEPASEAEAQEAQNGNEDPVAQEEQEAEPQEVGQEGATGVVSETMGPDEEAALRLVEQILEEQQLILTGQNFVYRSDGRRDPFRNILSLRRRELEAPETRPPGLAGFLISEISVSAAARFQGRWHVLVTGLDRRTYTATVGTELYDGRIVEISLNEVVFEQEVQDMLGARSTRRVVRKINEDQD